MIEDSLSLRHIFAVAAFGAVGVVARLALGRAAARWPFGEFPYGTLAINVVGSFLIGLLHVGGAERNLLSPEWRMALSVGLLGGFTTFSTFSLEAVRLLEGGMYASAAAYFLGSPLLGVAAAGCGIFVGRLFLFGNTGAP